MKRFFIALLAVLMGCGMVWAGVTASSGTLTEDLASSPRKGTKYLRVHVYSKEDGNYNNGDAIKGATVTAKIASTGALLVNKWEENPYTLYDNYDFAQFGCEEGVEYEIEVVADGYETQTQRWIYSGDLDLKFIMRPEGADEGHAELTGSIAMEENGDWPKTLNLALTDASGNVVVASDLKGTYSFPNIELGTEVKYHLTASTQAPISDHPDYIFVESNTNPMVYTLPDEAATAVVTKNLTVRYLGTDPATVVGAVLDKNGKCMDKVNVTISNGTTITKSAVTKSDALSRYADCDNNIYKFTDIPAGTYTLEYSKADYYSATQEYEFSVTGPGQIVVVPPITLTAIPMTNCSYYGYLTYKKNSQDVPVEGATVSIYSDAACTDTLATAVTDKDGYWIKAVTRRGGTMLYFDAQHKDIVVEQKTSLTVPASTQRSQEVNIACKYSAPEASQVSLTLNVSPSTTAGTISGALTGTSSVDSASEITLTATAKTNYRFKAWVNANKPSDTVSKDNPFTFTAIRDTALTAVFVRLWPFTVTSNNLNWGTVSGAASGDYEAGQTLTVTAVPKSDRFRFKGWVKSNDTVSRELTYTTQPLSAAVTLQAIFIPLYQVNLVAVPAEGGTLTGGGLYERSQRATVTATPNAGYRFGAWMSGNVKKTENTTYTTIPLTSDTTLRAIFVPTANVQLSANNNSYGTVSGAGTFDKDSIVEIEAVANAGHRFVAWVSGTDTVAKKATATFRLSRDTAIVAVFVPRHTLTLAANPAEAGSVYGNATYDLGQKVTVGVDFEDEDNYKFKGWIDTNNPSDTVSRTQSFQYTVNGNASLTAVFVRLYELTLSKDPVAGGTVTGAGTYEQGQKVAINATANANYRFKAWVRTPAKSDTISRRPDTTVTMDRDRGYTAVFVRTFTLAVSANDAIRGTVTGSGTYDNNSKVTVTATANPGYHFMGWKDDAASTEYASTESSYTFTINSAAPLTLIAEFVPLYTLTLQVNDADMGSVKGAGTYEQGRMVTVSATANEGYTFDKWVRGDATSVDMASDRPSFNVTVNADITLTAIFSAKPVIPDSANLNLVVKDNVGGTVQGGGKYEANEEVIIKAIPDPGYRFEAWMEGATVDSKDAEDTITIGKNDLTLTAVFVPVATLSMEVNDNTMGYVQTKIASGAWNTKSWPGSKTYDKGTVLTISAVSNSEDDYLFKAWMNGNDTVSKDATFSMTMNRDTALKAVFVHVFTLTLEKNYDNRGDVTGDGTYEKDQQVTITATAKPGFRFKGWMADPENPDVFVSTQATYTFTMTEDLTLTARFVSEYTVALTADPARGTATGAGTYASGDRVTITATPVDGYRFDAWTENGNVVTRENPRTFTIAANRNLTAVFVPDSSTLILRLSSPNDPRGFITTEGGVQVTGQEKELVYRNGSTVTVTATPKDGYRFEAWMYYTDTISKQNPYSFVVDRDTALRVLFVRDSATITLEVNDARMGTVKGAGRFAKGNSCMIEAEPKDGYAFEAWKDKAGNVISAEPHFEIDLVRDTVLTAVFFADSSYLRLTVNNAARGTVEGEGRYRNNKTVTIKATPKPNYVFKAWMSGETEVSDEEEYEFTISCDTLFQAVFVSETGKVDSFDVVLRADARMGRVEGAGRYEEGEEVTVKAIANEGYLFKGWVDKAENPVSDQDEFRFTVDRDTTLTAVFEALPKPPVPADSFNVVIRVEGQGTVTGEGRYEEGSDVTVTAEAAAGYVFKAWKDGQVEVCTEAEYIFTLTEDRTLTAVFVEESVPPVANEDAAQDVWSAYAENHTLVLRSEVDCRYEVYTVAGTMFRQGRSKGGEYRIAVNNSGLYIIRRTSSIGSSIKKVMVR